MTGHRHLELPADRLAPRRARLEVRDLLAEEDREDRSDGVASLLVTELVTNAVRHVTGENGTTVSVNLEVKAGRLRVEVVDEGAGFDVTGTSDGYGLLLVDRLADGWGVVSGPPHRVWCELTV